MKFYSVAEHSVHLARYFSYDNTLALWALLHDASEAYLVDVPRPVKPFLSGYKDAESAVMAVVCERFSLPHELPAEVKEADSRIIADEFVNMKPMPWHAKHNNPLGIRLEYWMPERAEEEFLATFYALQNMRAAA